MMAPVSPRTDWLYVGAQLKVQREALNLAADEIAQKLCLTVKQVKAMEGGNTLPFPGSAAHLWCIKRYANSVGIDWQTLLVNPAQKETTTSIQPDIVPSSAKREYVAETVEPATPMQETSKTQSTEKKRMQSLEVLGEKTKTWSKLYIFGSAISIAVLALAFIAIKAPIHPQKSEVLALKAGAIDSVSTQQQEDLMLAGTTQPAALGSVGGVTPELGNASTQQISLIPNVEQENTAKSLPMNAIPVVAIPKASTPNSATKEMIEFYGVDPNKQSGSFYINARNAVTLIKKIHDEAGDGVAIELARGTEHRISIAEKEVIKVAQGDSFTVYYQGQMVPPSTLRSGKWVRLIPKQENQ